MIDALRKAGYDVVGVGEMMPTASDTQVIACAAQTERILITNDKDFGEKVFRWRHQHAGVLLLRLHDESANTKAKIAEAVLRDYGDHLAGNFTVATERTVRVRRL
ncbi:MAG: DUF5615 family PIN-like protein [Caldilineales bacterium]|nr:DUF5615 family PIN-like protein [Caldilineales bacterium]